MHTCGGEARLYLDPKIVALACCRECRAPIAPEQPFVPGHAGFQCTFCFGWVGFCAAGLVAAVLDDAERVIGGRG